MDRSSSSNTTEEWQPELLAEFRFTPPDDQMAKLLKKKVEGKNSPINHKPWVGTCGITNQFVLLFLNFFKELVLGKAIIPEIDVYKFDAWDLPGCLFPDSPYQAREWFAYSRPDYKNHSSSTCNRTTKNGFWKVTTRPRRIDSESGTCFRKTMTFHEGRVSKSKSTGWVMQEYYFSETEAGCYPNQQKRALVLCRLRRNKPAENKSDRKKLKDTSMSDEPFDPTGTGGYIVSNSNDDQAADAAAAITYVTPDPQEHLPHKELDAQEIDDMTQYPQISQHSSPQVDQQSPLTHPKAGTPSQTASSPFVILSPSTPIVPCPMPLPGDLDKPSLLSNAGKIGHQQTTGVGSQAQSLALCTPGISASPWLAEFSVPDGTHVNALSTNSGKSSATEQPIQRLIKAVKSISSNALSASVSDIGSVVSMIDRIAGSGPGPNGANGTRKRRRYTSAVPSTSGYIVSNSDNDQAADAASAITYMTPDPDPEEHLPHKELEAQEIEDIIQRFWNWDPPQQLGNYPDVYNDQSSNWESPIGDNDSYPANNNNISTNYDGNEPARHIAYNDRDGPTYERSSEVFSQWDETLGSLFHSFQPQNNTSQPQTLYSEQGDFQHPNNYIGCYRPQSQYSEIAPLFP